MKPFIESINMLERRFNLFPAKFYWRGQVHNIDAVNECKTITNDGFNRATYHYWVRCDGQLFHLSEVLPTGHWLLHHDYQDN